MNVRRIALLSTGLLVLLGVVLWSLSDRTSVARPAKPARQLDGSHRGKTLKTVKPFDAARLQALPDRSAAAKPDRKRRERKEHTTPYTGEDGRIVETMQLALDADDLKGTLKAAEAALKSANPGVRLEAVEALGWFEDEALPELTVFMADANEEVAKTATGLWELALARVDDPKSRLATSLLALKTLKDEDGLAMIASHFSGAANELVDGEQDETKAFDMRVEIVQSLVDLMEDADPRRAELARDIYRDVTGGEWVNIDEAEKYLRDPDNYVAPDVDESGRPVAPPPPEQPEQAVPPPAQEQGGDNA